MNGIDKGIYTVLSADVANAAVGSLGDLGVKGVHHGNPPKGAETPLIRFQQMSAPVNEVMGDGPAVVEAVYMILCVVDGNDQLAAGDIAQRVRQLLRKQPLDCSPSTHMRTLWDRDLDIPEHNDGREVQQVGANYRVWVYE